ncbi:acyltransferase family protein [Actinomadura logoneensis]|uniref:acyltransferase family protein n=1 Tax=Actinomadura logoneensis TaxID=2293572 RepID=UPI001F1BABCD|nr:acyltransferase [Actinomadura logoneensis]
MAEQPALPAWHAERYRRLSEDRPSLVTVIEATTPPGRDRAVDALRALAIAGVVLGHWLVTAMVETGGVLHPASPLTHLSSLTPLTWTFQTLALFFLVGGYTAARSVPTRPRGAPEQPPSSPQTNSEGSANVFRSTNQRWPNSRCATDRRATENAHGWEAGQQGGTGRRNPYWAWLGRRIVRLVAPVPVLLAVWAAAVPLLMLAGYPAGTIVSLITLVLGPLWFLLVFTGLTALTPLVARAVRRWGAWTAAFPVAVTALVDLARFDLGAPQWIGWVTVASAWLVPFTLGVAWAHGSFPTQSGNRVPASAPMRGRAPRMLAGTGRAVPRPGTGCSNTASASSPSRSPSAARWKRLVTGRPNWSARTADASHTTPHPTSRDGRPLPRSGRWTRGHLAPWGLLIGGGGTTVALVAGGGYRASMVGVPGQAVSNLSPPTLAAVAFGLAQCGGALLLRGPLTRLMRRPVLWAGVAVMNLSAMTVFLWHQSALLGVSALVAGVTDRVPGLLDAPDHPAWLAHRLTWLPVFAAVLVGMWSLAHRSERHIRFQPTSRPVRLTKRSNVPQGAFGTRRTSTGCTEH